ncbi:14248_t:CDS:2 [Funneliformis caledonium]|uniref:14248_t:CDS:1 n=1 Tax=Funneliformis caledonium TaxID=1117310 RepID=A0A9N9GAN1_9GLOM|nr:14248_t:CDS:2 [Funneliformis caledonium]
MSIESDTNIKKDLKCLKEIMLSGEKYATVSFIYYIVNTLQIKVIPKEVNRVVDLINNNNAFDDVKFEDSDDNDIVIMNESQNKRRNIKIKNPLNSKEGLISALLNPYLKGHNFIFSFKKGIISFLYDKYQSVKESEEFITNITNNYDLDLLESSNSLLIDMFTES